MKVFSRGLLVAFIAVGAGIFVRLRAKEGQALTVGGWRELEGPDFR